MACDFTNVRKWVTGDRFVGRDRACDTLVRNIRNDLSSAIIGLRRIGKTSVLKEVRRRLELSREMVVVEIDMEEFTAELENPEVAFLDRLIMDLEVAFGDNSDVPVTNVSSADMAVSLVFSRVRRLLKHHYVGTGRRVALLLDEFDICAKWGNGLAGFLQRMRTLVDNAPEYGLVCVLASSRAIKMLEAKTVGDASTLDNALEKVFLKMLSSHDLDKLSELSEAPVSEESRLSYYACSFGHPFLYGLLLRQHNILWRDGLDVGDPGVIKAACGADYENYFDELRHVFESFPVGSALSSVGIANWFDCLVWREIYFASVPVHIVKTFKEYGLWNDQDEMPEVLHDFLARHQGDVWRELGILEKRLRRFVGRKLKAYYGNSDRWFQEMRLPEHGTPDDPWRTKDKGFQQIVHELHARRQKEQPDMPVDYLDCTYLDDLMSLMQIGHHWQDNARRKWKGFGAYFDGDVEKCRKMILAAGAVRNPEAHFVDYPERFKSRFGEAFRYLSAVLDRAEQER